MSPLVITLERIQHGFRAVLTRDRVVLNVAESVFPERAVEFATADQNEPVGVQVGTEIVFPEFLSLAEAAEAALTSRLTENFQTARRKAGIAAQSDAIEQQLSQCN